MRDWVLVRFPFVFIGVGHSISLSLVFDSCNNYLCVRRLYLFANCPQEKVSRTSFEYGCLKHKLLFLQLPPLTPGSTAGDLRLRKSHLVFPSHTNQVFTWLEGANNGFV